MKSLGVELLVCPPFESFYDLSPEEFVHKLLHEAMHCVAVVCGADYRFGSRGAGDVAMLRTLCAAEGIEVDTVPAVLYEGEVVSSTRIRNCLSDGKMALGNAMLCEPYRIEDFATMEGGCFVQSLPHGLMAPKAGGYRSMVSWNGATMPSLTQVSGEGEKVRFHTEWPFPGSAPERQIITLELLGEEAKSI